MQKSISKNHSTSVKNLDNGRKISDQPQNNNHCIVTADWADTSARGDTRKNKLLQNPEQPSKIIRQAQVAHGLLDKEKIHHCQWQCQRKQIHTENPKQASKITRQAQTGHDSADTKRKINTDVMGKVQTQRVKKKFENSIDVEKGWI